MANRLMINVRENYYLLSEASHSHLSKRNIPDHSTGIVGLSQLPGWTPYDGLAADQRATSVPFEFQEADGRPQSRGAIQTHSRTHSRGQPFLDVESNAGFNDSSDDRNRRSITLSIISGRRRSAIEDDFELRTFSESRGFWFFSSDGMNGGRFLGRKFSNRNIIDDGLTSLVLVRYRVFKIFKIPESSPHIAANFLPPPHQLFFPTGLTICASFTFGR